MEAVVLLAVVTVPLFFNPYSARVFEAEKVSLLRALALVAATVWLIRFLEGWDDGWPLSLSALREQPVVVASLLIALVTVVAGFTSITPRLSVWGSYQRSQGIITTLGYVVLFLATFTTFRSSERRRRLVTTLLAASAPIALYAIIQYAGFDPVPLRSIDPSRVFATLSNPIFLGAYLAVVIPLTLAQIVRYRMTARGVRWGGRVAYGVLLGLQLVAAVLSGSRGPWLGIAAGVGLFLFLLALQSWRRWLAAGLLAGMVVGLAFLGVLNLPNTPLAPLRSAPVMGRFGHMLDGGSARVRVLIWRSVVERLADAPARLALGYGPESTHAALLSTYQPELRHLEPERLPDRAHNVFLEALVTTGFLGAASVVFLFGSLLYTGLWGLGRISDAGSRNRWLGVTAAGVVLGLLVPWAVEGSWTFAGVGVGLGLVAGLGTYLALELWQSESSEDRMLTDRTILMAAVLAALVGHVLEITVGIRVTATETLFWVLAGLLAVLSVAPEETAFRETAPPSAPEDAITLTWDPEQAGLGLLGGVMLSTLAFGTFLLSEAGVATSSLGRWTLLIGAWLLAAPLWRSSPDAKAGPGTGWIFPLVSLGWAGVFLGLRAVIQIVGGDAITLLNFYFVWLLLSLVALVGLLPHRMARPETGHTAGSSSRMWRALVYPVLGAVTLGLVVWLAVKPLHAGVYLHTADANASAGQWSRALAFYRRAAAEAPDVDVYQQHLGEAYASAARLVQDPNQREAFFQAGQQAFQRAVTLNPAEGTHLFNLAHLYLVWAQVTGDPGRQATRLNRAADLYAQAASEVPNDPAVLNEWGLVLQAQGNTAAALAKYRAALEMDPGDVQAHLRLGNLYQRRGKTEQALQMYQRAIELGPNRVEAYRGLADLYREEGRLMDAVAAQERAAQLQPTDYTIHQNLALLYRDLGQIQNAVAEARLALNYAPPERRPALQSFIQSLLTSNTP